MQLTAKDLKIVQFCSDKETRPELNNVMVKGNKLVATDGYRLVEVEVGTENEELSMLLSSKGLSVLKPKKNETVQVSKDGAEFGVSKVPAASADTFPHYESIVPAKYDHTIHINGRYLAELAKFASLFNGFEEVQLSVPPAGSMKPIRIEAVGGTGEGLRRIIGIVAPINK